MRPVHAIQGLLPPQLHAQADAPNRNRAQQAEEVVHADYAKDMVAALTSQELDMALQDRVVQETNDAKNRVEEYVYNMRDALSTRLASYEHEDTRAALSKELDGVEVLSCPARYPSALVRVSMCGHVGAANGLRLCLWGLPGAVHRALFTLSALLTLRYANTAVRALDPLWRCSCSFGLCASFSRNGCTAMEKTATRVSTSRNCRPSRCVECVALRCLPQPLRMLSHSKAPPIAPQLDIDSDRI